MITPASPAAPRGYTVQEAAAQTGLSEHTLRYYERAGLIAPIQRDQGSRHRRYTDKDLRFIQFLKRMRATGMPICDMQRYATLARAGDHTIAARQAMLEAHRQRVCAHMAELESHLTVIDFKIANYQRLGAERNWNTETEVSQHNRLEGEQAKVGNE